MEPNGPRLTRCSVSRFHALPAAEVSNPFRVSMYATMSTYSCGARLAGASSGMVADMRSYRSAAVRLLQRLLNALALNSLEAWQAVHEPRNAFSPLLACSAGTDVTAAAGDASAVAAGAAAGVSAGAGEGEGPDAAAQADSVNDDTMGRNASLKRMTSVARGDAERGVGSFRP